MIGLACIVAGIATGYFMGWRGIAGLAIGVAVTLLLIGAMVNDAMEPDEK